MIIQCCRLKECVLHRLFFERPSPLFVIFLCLLSLLLSFHHLVFSGPFIYHLLIMPLPSRLHAVLSGWITRHFYVRMTSFLQQFLHYPVANTRELIIEPWVKNNVRPLTHIYQPLHSGRIWHKVNFFKRSFTGLNSEFSFS